MAKNKFRKANAAPSVGKLVEWFDEHDTGDYLAQMPEVDFEINIKRRRHLVELEPDLAASLTKIAKAKKVSSETLVNSWVREKISEPKRLRQ